MKRKVFKHFVVAAPAAPKQFAGVVIRRSKEESDFVELVMSRQVTGEVELHMNDASERIQRAMSAPFLDKFRKTAISA